jgi:hypothetical protein
VPQHPRRKNVLALAGLLGRTGEDAATVLACARFEEVLVGDGECGYGEVAMWMKKRVKGGCESVAIVPWDSIGVDGCRDRSNQVPVSLLRKHDDVVGKIVSHGRVVHYGSNSDRLQVVEMTYARELQQR